MATWNSRGLRGSELENFINQTNAIYQEQELALIQKIPTPITPIEIDQRSRHITLAYFEKKSTVDYIGAVQGIPVCFDAKECDKDTFPMQNIHEHQMKFMEDFEIQRGIAFFLLYYSHKNLYYYLRFEEAVTFWNRAKSGGRKSFRMDELDPAYFFEAQIHPLKAHGSSGENGHVSLAEIHVLLLFEHGHVVLFEALGPGAVDHDQIPAEISSVVAWIEPVRLAVLFGDLFEQFPAFFARDIEISVFSYDQSIVLFGPEKGLKGLYPGDPLLHTLIVRGSGVQDRSYLAAFVEQGKSVPDLQLGHLGEPLGPFGEGLVGEDEVEAEAAALPQEVFHLLAVIPVRSLSCGTVQHVGHIPELVYDDEYIGHIDIGGDVVHGAPVGL